MTDDTEHDDHGRTVSLPLLDAFAALEAELAAKEERIERLERELADAYLDSEGATEAGTQQETAGESDDTEATGVDVHETTTTVGVDADGEPRSHEDWVPETDPLEDTGPIEASADDHEGLTAEAATDVEGEAASGVADEETTSVADDAATNEADEEAANVGAPETSESDPSGTQSAAEHSGLKPVRTAGEDRGSTAAVDDTADRDDSPAEGEFGVTMQSSSNLTAGSLGGSADDESTADGDAEGTDSESEGTPPDPTADRGERLSLLVRRAELLDEDEVVDAFVEGIDGLDDVTRNMLAHYREAGDAAPVDAHVAAGGSGERQYAYARNRTLRKAGVIEHDGADRYRYALPELVAEAFDGQAEGQTTESAVAAIESATGIDE